MVKLVKTISVTFLCLLITFCSTVSIAEARNISAIDQHHIFPQQFRPDFERMGVDIDNYTLRIPKQLHQNIHNNGYNNQWYTYLQANPSATQNELIRQAGNILGGLGLTGRQELFKYSQASVQKTGEIIVKHPVWILRLAGNIGETFVKWFGGTNLGGVIIAFLASVGATVLGWFGTKADNTTLVGVGILTIVTGLVLFSSVLYLTFLVYNWLFYTVVIPIAAAFSIPFLSEA